MSELKEGILILIFALFVVAVLARIGVLVQEWKCGQKWADSGMEYQYSWGGGCRIKTPAGVWIPAENYREI